MNVNLKLMSIADLTKGLDSTGLVSIRKGRVATKGWVRHAQGTMFLTTDGEASKDWMHHVRSR